MSGFHDWIRNKLYKRRRTPLTIAPGASVREIRSVVNLLCDRRHASHAYQALQTFGDGAAEVVEWALDRPEFHSLELLPHTYSPYRNLLRLLTIWRRPSASARALALLENEKIELRIVGMEFYLATGRPDAVARANSILERCCTEFHRRHSCVYALRDGIESAVDAGRAGPEFNATVYPLLLSVVIEPKFDSADTLGSGAKLLLKIDRGRAVRDLTSETALSMDNRCTHIILHVLFTENIPVDAVLLLKIMDQAEQLPLEYPVYCVIEWLLKHLARMRHPETAKLIERHKDSPNETVAEAACDAMCLLHGLRPARSAFENLKKVGFDALTVTQQQFIAVTILDGEVGNGGFLQYFSNPSGERTYIALEGLRHMGMTECAAILQDAIDIFGPGGVSTNRDERNEFLGQLLQQGADQMSELDSRWYESNKFLQKRLLEFALANPDHFR